MLKKWVVVTFLGPVWLACSGSQSSEGEPGDEQNSTEQEGGDQRPVDEPEARAAFLAAVEFPSDSSLGSCAFPTIEGVGDPPPLLPDARNQVSDLGGTVPNGQEMDYGAYQVSCSLGSSGEGTLSATITGVNDSSAAAANSGAVELTVSGELGGDADVSFLTTESGSVTPVGACHLTELTQMEGEHDVAFAFACEQARISVDDFSVCRTRGAVVLSNCD